MAEDKTPPMTIEEERELLEEEWDTVAEAKREMQKQLHDVNMKAKGWLDEIEYMQAEVKRVTEENEELRWKLYEKGCKRCLAIKEDEAPKEVHEEPTPVKDDNSDREEDDDEDLDWCEPVGKKKKAEKDQKPIVIIDLTL
jgi:regulator of replication initiation timing